MFELSVVAERCGRGD